MRKTIYESNFDKMVKLGIIKADGSLAFQEYKKIESKPYMPLSIDMIAKDTIAMAHNYIQEGDVMADPDMEIRIIPEMKMIEALTYQQDGLGIFQRVYTEDGKRFYPKLKKDLNSFLGQWLNNLINQGFSA